MDRTTRWLVSRRSPESGIAPGPFIPTLGYPTTASDLYRVVGYQQTGHEGWNSCYTDIATCRGLATVVEGEVTSWEDIEAAETALQVLLWHDRVDVMVPGFMHRSGQFANYVRSEEERSPLCFDLFAPVQPFDVIYAVEEAVSSDGVIVTSTLDDSPLIGRSLDGISSTYLQESPVQAKALSAIPPFMGVPAYFSNPVLERLHDNKGHFGQLYDVVRKQWDAAAADLPVFELNVNLPPLLSIVLDRSSGRDDIPRAVQELRDELAAVRNELLKLNELYSEVKRSSINQVEVEERFKYVRESFEAAFRASRYHGGVFFLPLLKLYKGLKSPLDTIINMLNPNYVIQNPHMIADRTVTGKMFSKLLVTDSMYSLLTNYFTVAEIQRLQKTKPA